VSDLAHSAALAVIGDIHGNVAALDAALARIRTVGVARGVCTGDIVLRGLEPDACVSRIALLGWPAVRGNTDAKVALRAPRDRSHPAAARPGSRSWTAHRLSDASLRYLSELPLMLRLALGPYRVLVMHGTPDDPRDVLVDEQTPNARLVELASSLDADCVVTGHTHRPLIRRVGDCLFVNPGSVGEALGDDHRPSWAWLEAGASGVQAHLERVEVPLARPRSAA
jgi:putative phosphoesterase